MAVQCLNPQELIIDNQPFLCTNISLQWQREPTSIKDAKTEKMILGHRQYKSSALNWNLKMDFARMNIDNLLLKPINGSLLSDVSTFFQDSNIYHVPIFGSIGVMLILVLCIPCMICLCCPACCAPLCYICGGNRNPIVIHHARLQDKKRHKAMIKHFGSPPASDSTPPLLGPRRNVCPIPDDHHLHPTEADAR